jgi:hypothetical protein
MQPCTAANAPLQQFTTGKSTIYLTQNSTQCLTLDNSLGPGMTVSPEGCAHTFTVNGSNICGVTWIGLSVCVQVRTEDPGLYEQSFRCADGAAALNRCRTHMTMWTIMKSPLLIGNRVDEMDNITLRVVTNPLAIAINQDALGVQAQRVSSFPADDGSRMLDYRSVAAVAAPCNASKPTQAWEMSPEGVLTTFDEDGMRWCVTDHFGNEGSGSWRAQKCLNKVVGTKLHKARTHGGQDDDLVLVTPLGAHLAAHSQHGASGPVSNTRYLTSDREKQTESGWTRLALSSGAYQLRALDRTGLLLDDKQGGVSEGGDFCLDLAADSELEVWAGPLTGGRYAVALLNRHHFVAANITASFDSFNASTTAQFTLTDVWEGAAEGVVSGSYTAEVPQQSAKYFVLTPV